MANKTIDNVFLHYGVRKEDMTIIEQACKEKGIDDEWFKEQILKPYNQERNNQSEDENKSSKKVMNILKKSLKSLK